MSVSRLDDGVAMVTETRKTKTVPRRKEIREIIISFQLSQRDGRKIYHIKSYCIQSVFTSCLS